MFNKSLFMKKCICLVFIFFSCNNLISQCWKSVSVGYTHVLAIANDNTLWGWGSNSSGQLGDGTLVSKNSPTQIGTDSDWKIVSAGSGSYAFTMAIKNDGTLWAWGNNFFGQVGDGTFVNKLSPVQIGSETNWKSVSAGYSHAMAVKSNGTLWTWGNSEFYALGNTAGYGGSFHRNIPAQVGTLNTWSMVSAGDRYSLALKTDGTVYGWGYNNGNPIGLNSGLYIMTPQIRSYNNSNVKFMSAGGNHSYDVKLSDNLLITWGSNVYGQSGGTTCAGCPLYYVKDMDCGDDTSAIIKTNGTLWYTGKKLGYSEPTVQLTNTFLQFGTASNWKSVSVGNQSAAAITNNGELWTWGWNFWGNLGNGTNIDSTIPIQVTCPSVLNNNRFDVNQKVTIHPNPVNDILKIITSEVNIDKLIVKDITGKMIIERFNVENKLDVSMLKTGIYFLHVQNGESFEVIKFIKE